jgi:hypothetical protein
VRLCATNGVFPLLTEVLALDHAIYHVIAQIRMNPLNERM